MSSLQSNFVNVLKIWKDRELVLLKEKKDSGYFEEDSIIKQDEVLNLEDIEISFSIPTQETNGSSVPKDSEIQMKASNCISDVFIASPINGSSVTSIKPLLIDIHQPVPPLGKTYYRHFEKARVGQTREGKAKKKITYFI